MIHRNIIVLFLLAFGLGNKVCEAQQLKPFRLIDRHCKDCSEMIYGDGFDLKDISESEADIEIRFQENGEHVSKSITVIKGSKGNFTAAYVMVCVIHSNELTHFTNLTK